MLRPSETRAPSGPVVAVINPIWESRVIFAEDSVNRGAPLAGLACRLYFLSPELTPLLCEGKIQVQLSEKPTDGQQTRVLEQWNIDKDTLKRLARKDIFGWGYTLFLPWQTYRKDIELVQMHVAFLPENGASPVYAPPAVVTLGNEGRVPIVQSRVPAGTSSERK